MPRDDIKTGESFDFQGFWWIPSEDESAHRAQGKLYYEPSDGITVEAVNLYGGPEEALNGPGRIPVLHGESVEGKPCTLLNVICSDSHGTLFGGHSEELLTSNFLVYGVHIWSAEEIVASRIRIGLRGLAEWLTARWPGGKAAPIEGGTLEIPLDGARLIFQEENYKSGDRFSEVRTATFSALFEFDQPTALADLNEKYVRPLHDLLILGTNEEIRVTERTILVEEEHEKWWDDKPLRETRPIAVVQRSELVWHADKATAFNRVPLPLGGLGEDPVVGVQRWYALRAELAGAGNSLFATINRRFRALEVDLLSLLSAAEGYHRARFDSPVVSEAEHKQAVKDMIGALPEHLQANYRGRLVYTNEQTQRQRLRELFGKVEAVLPKAKDWSKLIHGLVQTRNFLTHWGNKSDDVLESPELIKALTKLDVVLRVNLMLDLGLEPVDIQTSVDTSHGQHSALAG